MKKCPNGHKVPNTAQFCPYDGYSFAAAGDRPPDKRKKYLIPILGLIVLALLTGVILLVVSLYSGKDDIPASGGTRTSRPTATTAPTSRTVRPTTTSASAIQRPTSTTAAPRSWDRPADDMTMFHVPAGAFSMGSSSGGTNEQPVHRVTLVGFYIDETEVTNAMYAVCVRAGVCDAPDSSRSSTRSNYYGSSTYSNYPVVNVSWDDARTYCQWAEARLPSEAEWEKAARGTDGSQYPWGNSAPTCSLLNYHTGSQACKGDTTAVGSYPGGASDYEILDMAGNVWEWVYDYYSANYYSSSPETNPTGPSSGSLRVVRGGSFDSSWDVDRSTFRAHGDPDDSSSLIGFRCARSE